MSAPQGYATLTPYLIVGGASEALEFYAAAFGAEERMRLTAPGGTLGHAEMKIGDSCLMLADEVPDADIVSPRTLGGAGVSLLLYVDDADAVFERAVAAGATVLRAVQDQFYGDRSGTLKDPFGHVWTVATRQQTLPAQEIQARFDALLEPGS